MLASVVYKHLRKNTPKVSDTELTALNAGSSSIEALLFRGDVPWKQVLKLKQPQLTTEERDFLNNEVAALCEQINDHDINHNSEDISPEIWEFLKTNGFFGLQIQKKYGGKGFSPLANSTIVATIASKSVTVAVTVMVPNSLGPAELLQHYGTKEQKQRYLPDLASGKEIPCFALTSPEAGSDATAIPDEGIVCKETVEGIETIGIRVSWDKRYITLAPVATLIGLAFKCKDPDKLIGDNTNLGITCALIPSDLPGVFNNKRHIPCGLKFMNGPTTGQSVFIPFDYVIGGKDYIGQGWQMLTECLSAGRGISLPALSTAASQVSYNSCFQYSHLRKQFGTKIFNFEGVKEPLSNIATNNLIVEALRNTVLNVLNQGGSPSVLTAIAKLHMTEMGRESISHAMDVHAGKAIQCGTDNYLNYFHRSIPIAITVEGANILTRSLIVFGQGAVRCHPFLLDELMTLQERDIQKGLKRFKPIFYSHLKYSCTNFLKAFSKSLWKSRVLDKTHPLCDLVTELDRLSSGFALTSDIALLTTGGDVKRKEHLSGRLGDLLSYKVMMFSLLTHFENNTEKSELVGLYRIAFLDLLSKYNTKAQEISRNSHNLALKLASRKFLNVTPKFANMLTDRAKNEAIKTLSGREPSLTSIVHIDKNDAVGLAALNKAFQLNRDYSHLYEVINELTLNGDIPKEISMMGKIKIAQSLGSLTASDAEQLKMAESFLRQSISVQAFPMYEKIKE